MNVALIFYNRSSPLIDVTAAILAAKPSRLFLIADGPSSEADAGKCDAARRAVDSQRWECEVYRNYATSNLGCRDRVVSGLDWVFDQVTDAIILEDGSIKEEKEELNV